MDVCKIEKKAFSLGKKFSQIQSDMKKLRNLQRNFFSKNYKLKNADEDVMNDLTYDIERIDEESDSVFEEHFIQTIQPKIEKLHNTLLDCKINFYATLSENNCCEHQM